jgi:hypothetical protein
MAEPSLEEYKILAKKFCEKYNQLNKTNFVFDGREKKQCDVDFYIRDGAIRLPVQYSQIQYTTNFFKSSAQAEEVANRIELLANRCGLKCLVNISFHTVPCKEDDINKFVVSFVLFLQGHIIKSKFKRKFEKESDLEFLEEIFKYISAFDIVTLNNTVFGLGISNQDWGVIRTEDEKTDYYYNIIKLKDSHYEPKNNLILIFDVTPFLLSGIALDEIRKRSIISKFHCKEIWQINVGNDGFCDKIYPYDENTD